MTVPWGPRPVVTTDGNPLDDPLAHRLRRVVVDTDLIGPGTCRMVLDDPQRQLLNSGQFDFGTTVRVAATNGENERTVFEGIVVSLGFDLDERGAFVTVTAFDRSFGLFQGTHTKSFQDVTDSDIATQIAQDVGLDTGGIEASSVVHEHVGQINETYWNFLNRRAAEIDYEVRVERGTLLFRPPTESSDAPAPSEFGDHQPQQLTPGAELLSFSARVTAVGQASQVNVRGWDVRNKQALVGSAGAATRTASVRDTPARLASTLGSPDYLARPVPLGTQAECDHRARAEAERLASASVHVEGTALGSPALVAGAAVSVGATGGRLDGRFTLTRTRHVWSASEYRTHFHASGVHDRSLFGLVRPHEVETVTTGVGIGIVTNVTDPSTMGRVKVKLPWLSDDYESDWLRVVQPGAGNGRGLSLLPEVNDEVLVAFQHGDPRGAVVVGTLHNGQDGLPFDGTVDGASGKIVKRGLKTRKGSQILLSDVDGNERIEIRTPSNNATILLDDVNKKVEITSQQDIAVSAPTGKVAVSCQQLDIEATADATIKANSSLTLQASGNVVIKGAVIQLN